MPFRDRFKTNEEYNAWFREYRRKNAEKLRAYNRKYNKEWRKKNGLAAENRWKDKNPEKTKAHRKVNTLLKYWKIKRGNCFCGIRGQAHHPDYNFPYRIVWLCSVHHTQHHLGKLSTPLTVVDLKDLIST